LDKSSLNNYTNYPSKGLNMDYSEMSNNKDMWVYARNVVLNSQNGDLLHIENEPSTLHCVDFPYTYISSIKLKDNRYAVFTTDNFYSEIGIFDAQNCSYSRLVNDSCLNFSTDNPIFGHSKENYDGSESIYWADGQRNELRTLNISKISYRYTEDDDNCKTKTYSTDLDCNELSFTKKINIPEIKSEKGSFGTLKNGTYQFAIAYSSNNQRITDYFSTTHPEQIWSHNKSNGSIDITISNLDVDFERYQLLVIANIDNQTIYKILGEYNINQVNHSIITIEKPEHISIPQEEISIKRTYYQKADYLVANDQFLFLAGVSSRKELNYQKQALDIVSKYVVYRVPLDHYSTFNDPGYYRDEVYSFSIQWLYDDGEWSSLSHIKNRDAKSVELQTVYGDDTFSDTECSKPSPNYYWQIYNTAEKPSFKNQEFLTCDRTILSEGLMAYHESTDLYPDNKSLFGEYSCTPIKHHKFPDESIVPRYTVLDGRVYLNILGVKFENISHPIDENGHIRKDIKGYRIWRGDRSNNRSVIARGVFTNVREYTDQKTKKTFKYSNYPYNYTKSDLFISEKQTYNKQNGEKDYIAPKTVKTDEFTFYSPHCLFDRVGLGDYVTFNSQETANVEGFFSYVNKHPKAKLLSDKVIYYATVIGAIDGVMRAFVGAKTETKYTDGSVTTEAGTGGKVVSYRQMKQVQRTNDILKSVANLDAGSGSAAEKALLKALSSLAKFGAFAYFMAETAQKVIDTVYNVTSWKEYAIQYNSRAFFNIQTIIKKENYRRRIDSYQYLSSGLNTLVASPTETYNNLYKEDNVFIKLNKSVKLLTGDNSQILISKSNTCGEVDVPIETKATLYYGTVKRTYPNQYGQLDTINYVATNGTYYKVDANPSLLTTYSTGLILGGDCYINKFSVNNPTDLFSDPLYEVPDGFPYNYRNYKALAYPRFWADTTPYEFLNIIPTPSITNKSSFPKESNLPRQKYNLDCKNKKGFSLINDSHFYTSINGVFEFIVESDYNLDLRDWKKSKPDFYTQNPDLKHLFKNKGSEREFEEFIYDKSLSKKMNDEYFYQQALDYDPTTDHPYKKNKTVYSLPAFVDQKFDSWLTFLPNNSFNFSNSQFGNLTSIQIISDQKLLFLFDKSSPYITPGRAELKTVDNETVYLGDGSLIRDPRPLLITDDNFGNCQSRYAFNNTKFGFFYPSQRKGNSFQFSSNLDEISRNGMYFFHSKELPSKLLQSFPNYKNNDNPFNGVGLTSAYDPIKEIYYLTKIDFVPIFTEITYNEKDNRFYYNNKQVFLSDRRYFADAGWTISYSPSLKAYISFHDYKPVEYLVGERNFFSVINHNNKSSIHQHNVRCDSYCNFYGVDYPHAFTLPINNGPEVQVLNSIEFQSETYLYNDNCKDRYHVLNESYNKALIYNTEQCSGWLTLNAKQKQNMSQHLKYDKVNFNNSTQSYDIYVDKVEQKYRFNQFRDISINRNLSQPLLLTDHTGYNFTLNPLAIDYKKSIYEKTLFRHSHSRLYLEKTVSGPNKLIFYLSNSQQVNSPR
jgi:hypothetical protein